MSKVETIYVDFFDHSQRRIDIYLPTGYNRNCRYPVIYFQDGENLFFDNRATYGKCWDLRKICDSHHYPFIVVGIYNGKERRTLEYYPVSTNRNAFFNSIDDGQEKGRCLGKRYATWMVKVLKPYIDHHYQTLPDFSHTSIAGSSYGAVITSYLASRYQDCFSNIGIFSLAPFLNQKGLFHEIRKNLYHPGQRYFLYVGTKENEISPKYHFDEKYLKAFEDYHDLLLSMGVREKNIYCVKGKGETHSEKSWSRYVNLFFEMILKDR